MSPDPHAVLFCDTNGRRQAAAFADGNKKDILVKSMIEDYGASVYGDWYQLPSSGAVDAVIDQANDLGGTVYNLPVR
ncbi:hypothetical protein E1B28_003744 [Marasmius oreades]|uniref:Uncharacterized protein n=1 Tax=Marasmius oreades TaxID=181124 RepID=A0A9P8ABQ3_9AGAR|nr:uncharacterized protein E1B28_003744 [Marasmius oreades]KAG7096298.1 hypothetical protein E1B28_003744 [Marasmius oreades]